MENIKKLNEYQHCRTRTEMYLGARTPHTQDILLYNDDGAYIKEVTWVPAVFTSFREILDNSLDEVIGHKQGSKIDVTYDEENGIFSVEDNGRGIPISYNEDERMHTATLALSHTRTGRNFDERKEVAGTNGFGAAVVNFCSEFFEVEIYRDGKKFTQKFSEGNDIVNELIISKPVIKNTTVTETGTKITWKLSSEVFSDMTLPTEFLKSRIYEIALINNNVKFTFNGELIKTKNSLEKDLFDKSISISINEKDFKSKFILVPNFCENTEFYFSVVNNIPAFNGGVHIDQFKKVFFSELLKALEPISKKKKLNPSRVDIMDKLLIYNVTTMNSPNFDSQSKTRLINEEAATHVRLLLSNTEIFPQLIKKYSYWIDDIYEKCAIRTNKKEEDEITKENKKIQRKKVPKLLEANSRNRNECILFIMEGDSAKSGIAPARNPDIHAAYPLKGKITNVNGLKMTEVSKNETLSELMSIIGLKLNTIPKRDELRYGKIYIAHDMDEDGKNIGALIINFFHYFWPSLFDDKKNPFINIFLTPFIIAQKGKEVKYWYSDDYSLFNPIDYKGWDIIRAKGLAGMTDEHWKYSLKHPKILPITSDEKLKDSLDLLFNSKRSDERKEWLGI